MSTLQRLRERTSTRFTLPGVLLAASVLLLIVAPFTQRAAFVMRPGIDGALTTGALACLLALLHGLSFRRILTFMIPIFILELVLCIAFRVSPPAFFGSQLLAIAIFGLGAAVLEERL